jgi:hypothetical protein
MQLALESSQVLSDNALFGDYPAPAAFQSVSFLPEPDGVLPGDWGSTASGLRRQSNDEDHQHQQQRKPMEQHHDATHHQGDKDQGDKDASQRRGRRGQSREMCCERALLSFKPLEMGLQIGFLSAKGRAAFSHLTSLVVITPGLLSLPPSGGRC